MRVLTPAGGPSCDAARRLVLALALALGLVLLAAVPPAAAQPGTLPTEYRIKAAFLYKFLSYVEWPAQALGAAGTPFVIGVIGPAAVVDELRRVTAGQTVAGHPVSVQALTPGEPLPELHVLFVVDDDGDVPGDPLAAAAGRPILTITEGRDDPRGIIDFVVVNDRVRFDIDLPAADASHLKISARLLNVARRVVPR